MITYVWAGRARAFEHADVKAEDPNNEREALVAQAVADLLVTIVPNLGNRLVSVSAHCAIQDDDLHPESDGVQVNISATAGLDDSGSAD